MHLLTLIIGVVLLPKVSTLKCYECGMFGICGNRTRECPQGQQCSALTVISYKGDSKVSVLSQKYCTSAENCVEGSTNFGDTRSIINSYCCNSDLCNVHPAPDNSKINLNGKKCYRCKGEECTTPLNCQGTEDRCISITGNVQGIKITRKGCVSKVVCTNFVTELLTHYSGIETTCCQGDYCNSASSTNAGLLLLVAPLIAVVFSS